VSTSIACSAILYTIGFGFSALLLAHSIGLNVLVLFWSAVFALSLTWRLLKFLFGIRPHHPEPVQPAALTRHGEHTGDSSHPD
jgi:hypothetical protein